MGHYTITPPDWSEPAGETPIEERLRLECEAEEERIWISLGKTEKTRSDWDTLESLILFMGSDSIDALIAGILAGDKTEKTISQFKVAATTAVEQLARDKAEDQIDY